MKLKLNKILSILVACLFLFSAAGTVTPAMSQNIPVVVDFSAGGNYCLAVKSDGTLWGWGNNQYGQLGDGTRTDREKPVQIGWDSDWIKVSAGFDHSLGIKKDGSVWAWGSNSSGQLGIKSVSCAVKPCRIKSGNWSEVEAGRNNSLILDSKGNMWECGDFSSYNCLWRQIGGPGEWKYFSLGYNHALAIKKDGTLWSWGYGSNGQLGIGKKDYVQLPIQVGDGKDWVGISAGQSYSLAQKKDMSLWKFGYDTSGRDLTVPAKVKGGSAWRSFSASCFTVAVKEDGTLWTWGKDNGADTINESEDMAFSDPVQIGQDSDWSLADCGNDFAAALKTDGSLRTWGYNRYGELGRGLSMLKQKPAPVNAGGDWASISAGSHHTLAIKADGSLWAWGYNFIGESGAALDIRHVERPVRIGTDNDWYKAFSAVYSSYTLKKDGTLWGWGYNIYGQIGIGSKNVWMVPKQIGDSSNWKDISAAGTMAMGLKDDGTLWIWGTDVNGDLFGDTGIQKKEILSPVMVGNDSDWSAVSMGCICGGRMYALALKRDGTLWEWGISTYGKVGREEGENFVQIGNGNDWTGISAGYYYAAAIKKNRSLWKWDLRFKSIAAGISIIPQKTGSSTDWKCVSSNGGQVLALKEDNSLWSFGLNECGEVGDGSRTERTMPVKIGSDKWKAVSAGVSYSMAIRNDGTLWGWGDNSNFLLGMDRPKFQPNPAEIIAGRKDASVPAMTGDALHGVSVSEFDGFLYYIDTTAGGKLIRVKTGTNDSSVLYNGNVTSFILSNGRIYFSTSSGGFLQTVSNLCSMKLDGSSWTILSTGSNISSLNLASEKIIYLDKSQVYSVNTDGSRIMAVDGTGNADFVSCDAKNLYFGSKTADCIYKCSLDGKGKTAICRDRAGSLRVSGQWAYYINNSDRLIYKVKTDGSGRLKLTAYKASDFSIAGGTIYYAVQSPNDSLTVNRIGINGSGNSVLCTGVKSLIGAAIKWVYYMDVQGSILKIGTDGKNAGTLKSAEPFISSRRGNTPGNINNRGYKAEEGDWIYYYNVEDEGKLYGIKKDGSGNVKISDDEVSFINVMDGWIYYCAQDEKDTDFHIVVYKIKTDGSNKTIVANSEFAVDMSLVGDWVYYNDANFTGGLCRIGIDGTNQQKLLDTYFSDYCVTDDWIYYNNGHDGHKLYKINIKSGQSTKLCNDRTYLRDIIADGDWIYYSISDERGIYRIRTDGTERTSILDGPVSTINISGDWIYYTSADDDHTGLYRVRKDGSGNMKISNANTGYLNIVNDTVFCPAYSKNGIKIND